MKDYRMFSHIVLGSNDLDRSKRFYDAIMAAIGGKPGERDAKGRLIYAHRGGRLLITRPIDGGAASAGNGGTIGLTMESADEAQAWHRAGVAHGGTTAEDPPGMREGASGQIFLAYLRDPDGHKLCAVHRPAG